MSKTSIWRKLSSEELTALVDKYDSVSAILRSHGYAVTGSSQKALIKRLRDIGVDLETYRKRAYNTRRTNKPFPLETVLVENSSYSRKRLKARLLAEGLIEKTCAICGMLPNWNNQPLVLQLDHINGVRDDNRLHNLRLLCPNCHSQTPTYGNK